MHIRDVVKKWTWVLKIVCYNPRNGPKRTFSWKRTCKPFWPVDIPLVLLYIKLWSVRGGVTLRVTKCIILAFIWARNFWFQRHLNGPKKAWNVYYGPKINENLAKWLLEGVCPHPGFCKKIDPSAENRVLPSKMAWNGRFQENASANPSGPETYPWCCYALNYGPYVEEGPLEWRNASFWLPFGHIILGSKGT
jgi:hypothetical protein